MSDGVLPNWIVAGAPRSSTTSLFRWLADHPQVCGPSEKETCYFLDPGTHLFRPESNYKDHGIDGYEKLFSGCDRSADVIVEATPAYFYSKTALRELPHLRSNPSFIFVLREPVAQIRSLFTYFQQNWNWIPRDMSFRNFIAAVEEGESEFGGNELAVDALRNAWYLDHLRNWRDAVGAERMLILLFEDVVSDSRTSMHHIADRLGIDPSFYVDYPFVPENKTYEARSGAIQDLNIWIRGRIPKGFLYDSLRRLYRAANTRPANSGHQDLATLQRLTERFSPMLPELERDFNLDLTKWRMGAAERIAVSARPRQVGAAAT